MTQTLQSTAPQIEKQVSQKWWIGRKQKTCTICQSKRSYGNPMAKCFECKKNFCFDHIIGGGVNKEMKQNAEVRDLCEKDFVKFEYHSI